MKKYAIKQLISQELFSKYFPIKKYTFILFLTFIY